MRFHHGNDISSGRHEFQCDMQNVFVEKKTYFRNAYNDLYAFGGRMSVTKNMSLTKGWGQ